MFKHIYQINVTKQIAIKASLAALISTYIYIYFQIPMGSLAILAPLLAITPGLGDSIQRGISALLGITTGCFVGLILTIYFLNNHYEMLIAFTLWFFICGYVVKYPTLAMPALLAGVFSLVIGNTAIFSADTAILNFFGLIVFLTLGLIIFQIINKTLWPNYAYKSLKPMAVSLLSLQSDFFDAIFQKKSTQQLACQESLLRKKIAENQSLLLSSRYELKNRTAVFEYFDKYYAVLENVSLSLVILKRQCLDNADQTMPEAFNDAMILIQAVFKGHLDKKTISTSWLEAEIETKIKKNINQLTVTDKIYNIGRTLLAILTELSKLTEVISSYKNETGKQTEQNVSNPFFLSRLTLFISAKLKLICQFKLDMNQLLFVARLLVCLGVLFYIQQYFNWASGFSALVTAYLVTGPTQGKTLQTSIWRANGAILGSLIGFGFLLIFSYFPNVIIMLAGVSGLIGICAYVSLRGAQQSYVGMQIALAALLVILPYPFLSITLDIGIERTLSVIIGGIIAVLVSIIIFPRRASCSLNINISQMMRQCKNLYYETANTPVNSEAVIDLKALLRQYANQHGNLISQVEYEKPSPEYITETLALIESVRELYINLVWLTNVNLCYGKKQHIISDSVTLSNLKPVENWFDRLALSIEKHQSTTLPVEIIDPQSQVKPAMIAYFKHLSHWAALQQDPNIKTHISALKQHLQAIFDSMKKIDVIARKQIRMLM